jgi:hypothetical protein
MDSHALLVDGSAQDELDSVRSLVSGVPDYFRLRDAETNQLSERIARCLLQAEKDREATAKLILEVKKGVKEHLADIAEAEARAERKGTELSSFYQLKKELILMIAKAHGFVLPVGTLTTQAEKNEEGFHHGVHEASVMANRGLTNTPEGIGEVTSEGTVASPGLTGINEAFAPLIRFTSQPESTSPSSREDRNPGTPPK